MTARQSSALGASSPSPAPSPVRRSRLRIWLYGTRPRTLPASIAPVVIGAAVGYSRLQSLRVCPAVYPAPASCSINAQYVSAHASRFWWIVLLCALVALFLQVAVNFANDYSDGIRGVDAGRAASESESRKPQRLTSSGLASPAQVLAAAGASALLACAAGLIVIVWTQSYWLLLVGALSLLAGWWYTGGRHPYGYAGFGELSVFVFFGLVAVFGTQYALSGIAGLFDQESGLGWLGAIGSGLLSCVMLMVNNLRDVDDDRRFGKLTLAVRLGESHACVLLGATYLIPVMASVVMALKPVFTVIASLMASWFGLRSGTSGSIPPCPAGLAECSTSPALPSGTSVAVAIPDPVTWVVVCGGLLMAGIAVLWFKALMVRDYRRSLALSSATLMLFALVFAVGVVAASSSPIIGSA